MLSLFMPKTNKMNVAEDAFLLYLTNRLHPLKQSWTSYNVKPCLLLLMLTDLFLIAVFAFVLVIQHDFFHQCLFSVFKFLTLDSSPEELL